MNQTDDIIPKTRITSIDALRGFALIGILLIHCMESFDMFHFPKHESPYLLWIDTAIRDSLYFLFGGKAYALFSLLFGLSFFIMMDSQAKKGKDFSLRFLWRLALLFVFGYITGIFYISEFFMIYALIGIILVPLYKVPNKILIVLCVLLLLQIPDVKNLISALFGNEVTTSPVRQKASLMWRECRGLFRDGSLLDVLTFNAGKGQWVNLIANYYRYFQMAGLFVAGMLIGRSGVYKDPKKMIYWCKKILPYAIGWFLLFYIYTTWVLPSLHLENTALLRVSRSLARSYGNLGMMTLLMCVFILLYHNTYSGRKLFDDIAAMGRMSLTNYMIQAILGVFIFYGCGLGPQPSVLVCFLIGSILCFFQICFSNWWIKRFYYGPMEWLWRTLTWFKKAPMKRKEIVSAL